MSILGTILSKIFPSGHAATASQSQPAAGQQAARESPAPGSAQTPSQQPAQGGGSAASAQPASTAAAQAQPVDVVKILDEKARANAQKLNWRTSIVDLMKLLGMDSSLEARKELAKELHYGGDTSDSAAMNIWLHKQVMQKLAQNGGKVPQDLLTH